MEERVRCELTGELISKNLARKGFTIRPSIMKLVQKECPSFGSDSWIKNEKLKQFKLEYVQNSAREEGFKTEIAEFIAANVANHDFLAHTYLDTVDQKEEKSTAEMIADKVATFMGSWTFIGAFIIFVIAWGALNTLTHFVLDPYPFQFLNLILGVFAALSAPLIMMSQNKEQAEDRKRAKTDFMVNLKSEFELRILREKIDHVIHQQNPHILDTLEMIAEDIDDIKNPSKI